MQIRDLPYPDPGVPDVRSGPRLLLWLVRRQSGGQLKALFWGTLHLSAVAFIPFAIGIGVQAVIERNGARLALAGGLLALLGALTAGSDCMLHRSAVTNWITAAARVQQLLARKTAELGSVLTRRVAAGEVVAVSTGDVEKIGWFVEGLSRFGAAVVSVTIATTALAIYQPELAPVIVLGVPLIALATLPLLPAATRRADIQRQKAGRATELASDTVAGLRVLRGIGGEELFLGRYRSASQEVRRAAVRSARMWSLISAVQVAMPGLLLLAVVWYGTGAALDGRIAAGQLVTVYGAVLYLLYPLRTFEEIAMAYSFSRPSARRAARVLGLRRETGRATSAMTGGDGSGPGPAAGHPHGRVPDDGSDGHAVGERKDGGRGTGDASAAAAVAGGMLRGDLYDPASGLLAPAGLLTAVVCGDPDAAGRLAERLGGHPVAARGDADGLPSVVLGGTPLDTLPLDAARRAVLVQDKDPVLLSGTLRDLLDVPASGAVRAGAALEAAQCGDVLDALARTSVGTCGNPMRSRITERGRSLSGGQRQRLALARSLITDPEVLVLDEPTSAVDSHTEARAADGLRRLRAGRTTVVFTSSPLLLDRADRVVLVTDGKVTATGVHRELLHSNPRYHAVVTRETETGTSSGTGPGTAAGAADGSARPVADARRMEETA